MVVGFTTDDGRNRKWLGLSRGTSTHDSEVQIPWTCKSS